MDVKSEKHYVCMVLNCAPHTQLTNCKGQKGIAVEKLDNILKLDNVTYITNEGQVDTV